MARPPRSAPGVGNRRATGLVAIACAVASAATAQAPQLRSMQLQLATDAGPSAWSWARRQALAAHTGLSVERLTAALEITADHRGLTTAAAVTPPADAAVEGVITLEGGCSIRLRATPDGREEWYASDRDAMFAWLRSLGLRPSTTAAAVETAALVGNTAAVADHDDPKAHLLRLGPAMCGPLTYARPTAAGAPDLVGHSEGGLSLPMLLVALATRSGGSADRGDPWVLAARCARGADRAEAARQLALSRSPSAADALERLLYATDEARVTAMAALVRRGDAEVLPEVIAAADRDIAMSEPVAIAAVWTLFGRASAETRRRAIDRLQQSDSPCLRALPGQVTDAPTAATAGRDALRMPSTGGEWALRLCWISAIALGLTLLARSRRA